MLIPNYHNDSEKSQLLQLLAEIRKLRKDLGAYIEHYYHDEDTIIIKLTNGIFKIKEQYLEKYFSTDASTEDRDVKKLAEGFVNASFPLS